MLEIMIAVLIALQIAICFAVVSVLDRLRTIEMIQEMHSEDFRRIKDTHRNS